jgi:hypothetical protein
LGRVRWMEFGWVWHGDSAHKEHIFTGQHPGIHRQVWVNPTLNNQGWWDKKSSRKQGVKWCIQLPCGSLLPLARSPSNRKNMRYSLFNMGGRPRLFLDCPGNSTWYNVKSIRGTSSPLRRKPTKTVVWGFTLNYKLTSSK